ncbi:hypothetical protein [Bacteroides acidifaciens]|uniref:hypothetical protein n=1 Tax=Bacteroides acidifaciens TaxID=85831 RepID=UPI002557FCD8|nr:hypothetical protein [Bacteroides acidifaciens]
MKKLVLNVFSEGLTPEQLNSVRGGAAVNGCTCYNGTYNCGCFTDCVCNGGTLTCSCNGPQSDKGTHPIE